MKKSTNPRIFRRLSQFYARVPRGLNEDPQISDSAIALYSYIMGKPPGWTPRMSDVRQRFRWGEDKQQRVVRELIAAGYARLLLIRRRDGTVVESSYTFHEEPVSPRPTLTKPRDRNGYPVPGSLSYTPDTCFEDEVSDKNGVLDAS